MFGAKENALKIKRDTNLYPRLNREADNCNKKERGNGIEKVDDSIEIFKRWFVTKRSKRKEV